MHREEVHSMRTTLDLDEGLVKELVKVTKAKTKTKAIHIAISEFLRRKRIEGLLALEGKLHLDLDWRELEERELKAQEKRERLLRGRR
jgi:Arc/MetJ family transcription regulator